MVRGSGEFRGDHENYLIDQKKNPVTGAAVPRAVLTRSPLRTPASNASNERQVKNLKI